MPGRKQRVLDSYALIAFLAGERGFERVEAFLRASTSGGVPVLMNEINAGEVYSMTSRKRSPDLAEEFLSRLQGLPIRLITNPFSMVIEAARIKAKFRISYADAFAAATARLEGATLVTGDPEFEVLEKLVDIEWL